MFNSRFSVFKKLFIFIIILAIILGGACYLVTTSKEFHRGVLSKVIAKYLPGTQLESFDYKTLTLLVPKQLTLEGVELRLKKGNDRFDCKVNKLSLTVLNKFLSVDKTIEILLEGLQVHFKEIVLRDGRTQCLLNITDGKIMTLKGPLSISTLDYGQYHLEALVSSLVVDSRQVRLKDFTAQAYDGKLKGEILVDYVPPLAYSIELGLRAIDTKRLQSTNESLFSQLEGRLNATIKLNGDLAEIKNVGGDFEMAQGGQIKADWLSAVVDYIPQSTQKEELIQLIKANGFIPVDMASLKMKSLDPLKLTSLIVVKSAKLNLDINLTLDINMEEDLKKDFLNVIQRFLPTK